VAITTEPFRYSKSGHAKTKRQVNGTATFSLLGILNKGKRLERNGLLQGGKVQTYHDKVPLARVREESQHQWVVPRLNRVSATSSNPSPPKSKLSGSPIDHRFRHVCLNFIDSRILSGICGKQCQTIHKVFRNSNRLC